MRPESVEIKVTLVGSTVGEAVAILGLPEGKGWRILFCEDVTAGVAPSTPLLDIGVVLRARKKSGTKGDSTVKLLTCLPVGLRGRPPEGRRTVPQTRYRHTSTDSRRVRAWLLASVR
jgi:hypothetical protein